jgi:pimeloyl-ACP methyl ester carboxylesterase
VRVVEVRRDRGDGRSRSAWIVHIPGTQEWAVDAPEGATPFDLTGNLHLLAGGRTAGTRAVTGAMTAAGVRPGERVLLVGHSQGGLVAAAVAADPAVRRRFGVSHVVTAGSPVAGVDVPPEVRMLALEHTDDLVAGLDGRANPDRRTWITVRAPAPGGAAGPLPPHDSAAYAVTAGLVDRSTDADLVAHRRSLAPFLDGPGVRVRAVDVVTERTGRGAPPAGAS